MNTERLVAELRPDVVAFLASADPRTWDQIARDTATRVTARLLDAEGEAGWNLAAYELLSRDPSPAVRAVNNGLVSDPHGRAWTQKQIIAAVFISLDTDLLVIPVSTKYVWYEHGSVGAVKEGWLFGAAEVVVRSGPQPIGQWVEERVNAYADFLKIHNHEPAPTAWGISLVTGPGVELDFGRMTIAKQ